MGGRIRTKPAAAQATPIDTRPYESLKDLPTEKCSQCGLRRGIMMLMDGWWLCAKCWSEGVGEKAKLSAKKVDDDA